MPNQSLKNILFVVLPCILWRISSRLTHLELGRRRLLFLIQEASEQRKELKNGEREEEEGGERILLLAPPRACLAGRAGAHPS